MNQVSIGCDHNGYIFKEQIKEYFKNKISFIDNGCDSTDIVDYPAIAHKVCEDIIENKVTKGILLCCTGNSMNIVANKSKGIRSAICWNAIVTNLARRHNDANIMVIPTGFISVEDAINYIEIFLNSEFDGGRHTYRIKKIEE